MNDFVGSALRTVLLYILLLLTGCTIHPPGERQERSTAVSAGKPFEHRTSNSTQPTTLPNPASADDLVVYALLHSDELESRYWQWRSAIEQIPQDGTQATTLNVSLGAAITRGRFSTDQTTVTLGNDPMSDLKWPGKLDVAAEIALKNARAAGLRFRKGQFDLRNKVLGAYYDFVLNDRLIALEEKNQQLLESTVLTSESRNRAGSASQVDVLKAQTESDLSNNSLANMTSQAPALLAAVNAALGRPADAPLELAQNPPPAGMLRYDDSTLLTLVTERNPELAAQAQELQAKADALKLAKLQYVPDFNVSIGTDLVGLTQSLLGQASVPLLRYEALNAGIAQAQANLRGTEAMRRQTTNDLAARVVLDLSAIHDTDRQLKLFRQTILPRTRQLVDLSRGRYESGNATLLDLLDSQRTALNVEKMLVNLELAKARQLADLESIAAAKLTEK
jgi:outer membrane protein TolC